MRSYHMEAHEAFILDELLPLVASYAQDNGHPSEAAALASFLALATILQSKGASREQLMAAIDGACLPMHPVSEVLQ